MGEQIPSEIEVATPNKLLMLLITAYTDAYLPIYCMLWSFGYMAFWAFGQKGEESELGVTP